ncbi:MAG: hypothetical protein IT207_08460 [Fimbriimonadaceae bacterium]|nr:hypothetical protein [Fimbriimonadaceae bacterium]
MRRYCSLLLAPALFANGASAARLKQAEPAADAALRSRAGKVARQLAELASSNKLQLDDATIRILRSLVDELDAINHRLNRLEGEPRQSRSDRTFVPSGYIQLQFRHSEEPGAETSAFEVRRAEVGFEYGLDERTKFRISVEAAGGPSRNESQLRDAWASHALNSRLELRAGQMRFPLGYDTVRSSAEREMLEPARYTSTLHSSERGRGVQARYRLDGGWSASAGVWDALAAYDPEQVGRPPGASGKLAWSAGLRKAFDRGEAGVSVLLGARPGFVDSAGGFYPRSARRFLYVDARYSPVGPLTLRFEAMAGHDRVPVRSPAPGRRSSDMSGWQAQADWALSGRDVLTLRYDAFDPGEATFRSFGVAFSHTFAPGAKLVAAFERYDDPSRARSYDVVTLRTQFRF